MPQKVYFIRFLHLVVRSLCTLKSLCHSCQFIVLWPSNFNYVFSAAVLNTIHQMSLSLVSILACLVYRDRHLHVLSECCR